MRLIVPLRATWRQLTPKRRITTKPATFANIKYELLNRPAWVHLDRLNPGNQILLGVSLNDSLPDEAKIPTRRDGSHWDTHRLLQGSHLAYCPPHHASSSLLPDGTDADHSPGAPFTRRLWAGGSVVFERNPDVPLTGDEAVCTETVTDVRLAGAPPGEEASTGNTPGAGEKIYVDVLRAYEWGPKRSAGADHPSSIQERRTLCFMTPKTAEEARKDVENPHRRAIRGACLHPSPRSWLPTSS